MSIKDYYLDLVRQLVRYAGVGIVITVTDYFIFLLCVYIDLPVIWSNATAKCAATLVGIFLHRIYTFAGPQRLSLMRQVAAYILLSAFNLCLSTAMILLIAEHYEWSALPSKIISDILIICISFVVSRLFIYAPEPH